MKNKLNLFILIFYAGLTKVYAGDIVIIGNHNVPKIDLVTIQKIYKGKIVSISDIALKPVNAKLGSPERNQFLENVMNQDEEKYTGYWTVRRYIGKGTPPNELNSTAEIIDYTRCSTFC
jgi:antitoxin (DNA-binding transcriptional repressor) of toxin-antitoxin stability system